MIDIQPTYMWRLALTKDEFLIAIEDIARDLNVSFSAFAAVVWVESNGIWQAEIDGRAEPLIRFEGHYFDRLVAADRRAQARQDGLANPRAGAVKNPRKQTARWDLLQRAQSIDRAAALESTSWGVGQVMGANWKELSYPSVEALVLDARSGPHGQLRLMARFIKRHGLDRHLREVNFAGFARRYNGPAFAKHGYHTRMRKAFERFAKLRGEKAEQATSHATERNWLGMGDTGKDIRTLQTALRSLGLLAIVDGDFGPATDKAVRSFQRKVNLTSDGKVGPETQRAMMFWTNEIVEKNIRPGPSPIALPRWLGYPSPSWNKILKPFRQ